MEGLLVCVPFGWLRSHEGHSHLLSRACAHVGTASQKNRSVLLKRLELKRSQCSVQSVIGGCDASHSLKNDAMHGIEPTALQASRSFMYTGGSTSGQPVTKGASHLCTLYEGDLALPVDLLC